MQFNTSSYIWGCPNFEDYQQRYHSPPPSDEEDPEVGDKKIEQDSQIDMKCHERLEKEDEPDFDLIRVPPITLEDIEAIRTLNEMKKPKPGVNMVNYA